MKNIDKYINESLLAEAQGKIVAFFDHYDPARTWLVIGADNKMIKRIPNGFDIFDIPNKDNLIDITHADEWGFYGVTDLGVKNENQLKAKVLKSIEKSLKENPAEKDYAYIKFDPIPFENEYEDYDGGQDFTKLSSKDWYQMLIDMYNDSYIDCDSSYARVVYDPKNKKVVFGGSMDIICYTAEEFEKVLKEWEDD